MNGLRIGGLTPLTTIDYPGELAAVVFCQGCPWRCRYCHNGHLVEPGNDAQMAWDEVLGFLRQRRGLLDAVVFSGGEPTLQRDLPQAIGQVRSMGFKVGLHTAGCYPERLLRMLPLLDWVGLDIKALPEDYPALTGVPGSGERALQSLDRLIESGVAHELRVTVHERLLRTERLSLLLGRLTGRGAERVVLQACRTGQMLDPGLGDSTVPWGQMARCNGLSWKAGMLRQAEDGA